ALPVVISSALETSVGLAWGVRAAATLPQLDYDCGLGTVALLLGDVVEPSLIPEDGQLSVSQVTPTEALLTRYEASPERRNWWLKRLEACGRQLGL
ncbi:MAG: O-succinylbenzoate synthase, partial [Actinomycetes bacterium]